MRHALCGGACYRLADDVAQWHEGVMLKPVLCMAAVAIGVSTAAYADGYGPSYAPHFYSTWTGFYMGVNGGYAWAGDKQFVNTDPISEPFSGLSPHGGFGGCQIGY